MKYLLVVILTLFFIGCYEEDVEQDFCENHICDTECFNGNVLTDIYNNNKLFMKRCLSGCSTSETHLNENLNPKIGLDSCTINIADESGICEITSKQGAYCEEFFNKYEE